VSRRLRILAGVTALLATGACAGPGTHETAGHARRLPHLAPSGGPATAPPSPSGPSSQTIHVVGLGDSVMAGTHCGCKGLAEEYGRALAAREGVHVAVSNLADDGKVTEDLIEDLRDDPSTQSSISGASVVLVTIGANDLLPELDRWRSSGCARSCFAEPAVRMGRNLAKVLAAIARVQDGRHGVVLVTDYWNVFTDGDVARSDGGQAQVDWSADVTAEANRHICAAARAAHDTCVHLVPVFKPGGADPTRLLASDGDHPDAAGVRAIVRALIAATPARP
jgi:lysophospholipase L1-like esterase